MNSPLHSVFRTGRSPGRRLCRRFDVGSMPAFFSRKVYRPLFGPRRYEGSFYARGKTKRHLFSIKSKAFSGVRTYAAPLFYRFPPGIAGVVFCFFAYTVLLPRSGPTCHNAFCARNTVMTTSGFGYRSCVYMTGNRPARYKKIAAGS